MDDHEMDNYEEFNPQRLTCPVCDEITHHEDWNDEAEMCNLCAEDESSDDDSDDVDDEAELAEADQKHYPQNEPVFSFEFFKKAAGFK